MRFTKVTRLTAVMSVTLSIAAAMTVFTSAASPKFYDDDPIWHERDTQDAAGMKALRSHASRIDDQAVFEPIDVFVFR